MYKIAFSPVYKYQLPENHRFPMLKYELLPEQLVYEGTVSEEQFFHPKSLTRLELETVHTKAYLDKLELQTLSYKEARNIGFPMTKALVDRGKIIARGTYECAKYAQQDGVALNIAGGTHHSFADHGEGFCVFNDIALASQLMLDRDEAKKILIIDLDVHQGNGTAKIFENEKRVFTFSMHGAKNYPTRKTQSDLDIGLSDHTEDELFLKTLKETLPRLIIEQEPDMIFYLSGVDIIKQDKLGRLDVSIDGCKQRDEIVFELCKSKEIPVVVSMGGGYAPQIADIIEAHANTFRVASDLYF